MKKRFTILIAAIAAIMLMAQPGMAVGQTRLTAGFTLKSVTSVPLAANANPQTTTITGSQSETWDVAITGTWTSSSIQGTANNKYWQMGKRDAAITQATFSTTINNATISSIVVNCASYNGTAKVKCTVGGSNFGTQNQNTASWSNNTGGDVTFSGSGSGQIIVTIDNSASGTRATYIQSITVTYTTGGGSTVDTPQISGETPFLTSTSVSITCGTAGASIQYSLDNGTNWSNYTSSFTLTETTTVKAKATKSGMTDSQVATKTFTKITPLSDIAALSSQTEAGTYYVTLDDAVVTFTDGYYAYIQDESGAILYYKNGHGLTAGKVLNGTAQVSYKLQYNLPEITELSGVESSNGDAPEPTTITQSAWSYTFANVYSQYFKIVDATITESNSDYYVSLGDEDIKIYKSGSSISSLDLTKKYTITGFPLVYNSIKEIQVFIDPAVEDITIGSSFLQLSYSANASGSMTVGYSNFTPTSVTAALYSDSGCNTSFLGDWISITSPLTTPFTSLSYNVSANETGANRTVYMKVSATNANSTIIHHIFTITQVFRQTYSVTYKANGGTGDDLEVTGYDYNTTVTVKANEGEGNPNFTKVGYTFQNWNTNAGGTGTTYIPNDNEHNTFNITANTNLFAQWQANTYDLHTAAMTNGSVSFKVNNAAATTAQTGQTVTLVVTPSTNYGLASLTVTNETTSATVTVTNNTFTMPASDIIVSATFKPVVTDIMTLATTGVSGNSYSNWTDTLISGAIYNGRSAGGNDAIQLRNKKDSNTPGIVTKTSGGKVKKVSVKWNSNTTSNRYITIYGKNTFYNGYADLHSNTDTVVGTSLGTITCGSTTELTISNDYKYIGIKASDVVYLDTISITWAPPTYTVTYNANGGTGTMTDSNSPYASGETVTVLSNSFTAPTGKEFEAWNTKDDGSGDSYNPASTFTMPKSNVTLYAQWIDPCDEAPTLAATSASYTYVSGEDRYKVDFSSSVSDYGECNITEYGFVYSTINTDPTIGGTNCTKVVIGTSNPEKDEEFTTTIASGTLGATYYVKAFATNKGGTAYGTKTSTTVPSSYPTYTISYSTNGNPDGSSTVNQGNAIGTLPTPTSSYIPDGYEFVGWYNGASYGSTTAPTIVKTTDVPTGNLSLKAVFAISPSGGEQNLEITIDNFSEITTSYTTEFTHNYSEATIKAYGVYKNSNGIQMNSGKGTYIKNTTAMPGVITRFELTWYNSSNSSITMYANTSSEASTSSTNLGKQTAGTSQTINTSISNGYKYFYFDGTTVGGVCYLSSFKIYYIEYYYTTLATEPSGDYWHVSDGKLTDNTTIPSGSYTLTSPLTIPDGKILTINGYLGTTPENLIVEDGGQIVTTYAVNATMQKKITAATTKDATFWYAISSAVADPSIEDITNLITISGSTPTYDLYRFNEKKNATAPWENYRNAAYSSSFTTLEKGRGYLYRNASTLTVSMEGEVNVANIDYPVTITDYGDFAGFNLIGNPYSHNIYKGAGTAIPNGTSFLSTGFYYMDPKKGAWKPGTDNTTPIKPNEGILVLTTSDGDIKMTNTTASASAKYNSDNIMFQVANSKYEDIAYAWFDKGIGLDKINHRNPEVPMLYIRQDGGDYAIATMGDDTKAFSLNFKAMTTGKYTLSYKTKGEFSYLHVIDKFTGEDVDMLLEGEYSFIASPNDSDARFIVKLAYLPDYGEGSDDIFAYQSGSEVFVSGEGELQVFDVLGRFVMSERINGVKTVSVPAQGVYVFRLVGENVKTQKIVIR